MRAETLRHPQQRAHRIAQCVRFDEVSEVVKQCRIAVTPSSSAAAFTANAASAKRRRINVLQASFDGAARQSSDVGHRRQTTPPRGAHFARGPQPPSPLVTLRAVRVPPQPNRIPVDHADVGTNQSDDWESPSSESLRRISGENRFGYFCGCPKQSAKRNVTQSFLKLEQREIGVGGHRPLADRA
jgi:hypothetical protein